MAETLEEKSIYLDGALAGKVSSKGFENISLMTGDMEAGGHGLWLDAGTLDTCEAALDGRSVPCYLTHEGAQGDRLGKEIGVVSGAYREGAKIRASKLNFLDSFAKHEPAQHDRLVELASTYPDQLGVSLVVAYSKVWVKPDGNEVPFGDPKPEQVVRNIPSMRVRDIKSADLVQRPAANIGLFSKKLTVDPKTTKVMETITLEKHNADLATKDAAIAELSKTHKSALELIATNHSAELAKKDADHKAALDAKVAELSTVHTAALAAKDQAIKDAELFDIRKTGVDGAIALAAKHGIGAPVIPESGGSDQKNWDIYSELSAKDKPAAELFYKKYLVKA